MTKATYETHQRRAIEPDGTVHAARYAGDRWSFATACAVYPAPTVKALERQGIRSVTCPGCLEALAPVITCPACKTPGAEEFGQPVPNTDDFVDCARCTACGLVWGLDPGADLVCTECGGSGNTGRGTIYDPRCTACGDHHQEDGPVPLGRDPRRPVSGG
nr:hypothetical protein OG690_38505 [Streptomyces tubercidicus]